MYQYTFSKEATDEITEKTNNYKNLIDNFKQIDDKFSSKDNTTLDLQKKTFENMSDDEIKQKAIDSLSDYKNESLDNIYENFNQKSKDIDEQLSQTQTQGEQKKQEVDKLIDGLKEDASNNALKRGLGRSSIVINVLDAFDKEKIEEYKNINNQIETKVNSLNSQKSLLSEQRQSALNSFDISYAVKLSNKIDEINEQLKKEEQKVLEYNNQIAEKEAEFKKSQKDDAFSYAQILSKYGDSITKAKQDEKFELAKEYFSGMSKIDALSELENNKMFASEVGPTNYSRLKVWLNSLND